MAVYKAKVSNCTSLNVRGGPGMSFKPIAWLQNGDEITVESSSNGWYKIKGKEQYVYSSYVSLITKLDEFNSAVASTTQIVNKVSDAVVQTASQINGVVQSISNKILDTVNTIKKFLFGSSDNKLINIDGSLIGISSGNQSVRTVIDNNDYDEVADYGIFYLHTNTSYPTRIGGSSKFPKYDWTINSKSDGLYDTFRKIQYNLDIPSYYSRTKVNECLHINFNRFRKSFPDMYLQNTTAVIIFTRPDLNLFDGNNVNSLVAGDPRSNLIINNHTTLAKLLTAEGSKQSHKFNPLLSNLADNLDVTDDTVDVLETAETYTGFKTQYSKHNIKSITSGTFSIKYKETNDLAVTNMHQLWVDYQSNVYRGIFEPKREYIYNKELDYACDVYYFLLGEDGETIKFWSKYYGVFPHNVPKSSFTFDIGNRISLPELNVTYSYIYKEDLSPVALIEFNNNAGVASTGSATHVKAYQSEYGHSGKTWVGTPFIYSYTYNDGMQTAQGFKLGWLPSNETFNAYDQY